MRENKRKKREGGGRGVNAELAERVLGDAYHSYLAKCIKTIVPRNIVLIESYDSC